MKTEVDSREPLIFPNIQHNKHWAILGAILTFISCGILLPLVRGPFFERPNYYNRKVFYHWLARNKLPEYKSIVSRKVWELSPTIKITLYKDGKWHLTENGKPKIRSSNVWGYDRFRYKEISSMLSTIAEVQYFYRDGMKIKFTEGLSNTGPSDPDLPKPTA